MTFTLILITCGSCFMYVTIKSIHLSILCLHWMWLKYVTLRNECHMCHWSYVCASNHVIDAMHCFIQIRCDVVLWQQWTATWSTNKFVWCPFMRQSKKVKMLTLYMATTLNMEPEAKCLCCTCHTCHVGHPLFVCLSVTENCLYQFCWANTI